MPNDNAQLVGRFYEAVLAGRAEEAIVAHLARDFVWENPLPEGVPFGGTFAGPTGAGAYLETLFSTLDLTDFQIDELVASGDKVVVLGHETGVAKSSGGSYTQDWVHVLTLRGGRITRLREYNDTAAIRAAFAPAGRS